MPRSPLSALCACTCAVLLAACQSSVAPTLLPPPPPDQPISIEISGPSQINNEGSFSWEAIAFGGSGAYRYQWEVTRQGQPPTISIERTVSLRVTDVDGDMMLRLTVTSGSQANAASFGVRNCIGGCDARK
jgi:hypothetical protein